MLGAVKGTVEVSLNNAIPKIIGHITDLWPQRRTPTKVRYNTRIVNQNIDAAKLFCHFIKSALYIFFVSHIKGKRGCLR